MTIFPEKTELPSYVATVFGISEDHGNLSHPWRVRFQKMTDNLINSNLSSMHSDLLSAVAVGQGVPSLARLIRLAVKNIRYVYILHSQNIHKCASRCNSGEDL